MRVNKVRVKWQIFSIVTVIGMAVVLSGCGRQYIGKKTVTYSMMDSESDPFRIVDSTIDGNHDENGSSISHDAYTLKKDGTFAMEGHNLRKEDQHFDSTTGWGTYKVRGNTVYLYYSRWNYITYDGDIPYKEDDNPSIGHENNMVERLFIDDKDRLVNTTLEKQTLEQKRKNDKQLGYKRDLITPNTDAHGVSEQDARKAYEDDREFVLE